MESSGWASIGTRVGFHDYLTIVLPQNYLMKNDDDDDVVVVAFSSSPTTSHVPKHAFPGDLTGLSPRQSLAYPAYVRLSTAHDMPLSGMNSKEHFSISAQM